MCERELPTLLLLSFPPSKQGGREEQGSSVVVSKQAVRQLYGSWLAVAMPPPPPPLSPAAVGIGLLPLYFETPFLSLCLSFRMAKGWDGRTDGRAERGEGTQREEKRIRKGSLRLVRFETDGRTEAEREREGGYISCSTFCHAPSLPPPFWSLSERWPVPPLPSPTPAWPIHLRTKTRKAKTKATGRGERPTVYTSGGGLCPSPPSPRFSSGWRAADGWLLPHPPSRFVFVFGVRGQVKARFRKRRPKGFGSLPSTPSASLKSLPLPLSVQLPPSLPLSVPRLQTQCQKRARY